MPPMECGLQHESPMPCHKTMGRSWVELVVGWSALVVGRERELNGVDLAPLTPPHVITRTMQTAITTFALIFELH